MPGKPDKPYCMRIRTVDGKPREPNKLKGQLVPHVDVISVKDKVEFVICAVKEAHLDQVRVKLGSAGLEEIVGGDTTIAAVSSQKLLRAQGASRGGPQQRSSPPQQGAARRWRERSTSAGTNPPRLPAKPYGFVALPPELKSAAPVWHDGTSSAGRLSGEIRCELETLTPLLVGWERQQINDAEARWPVRARRVARSECAGFLRAASQTEYPDATDANAERRKKNQASVEKNRRKYIERLQDHILDVELNDAGWIVDSKFVTCPLRAPWGKRPLIIPGDSLKGLLRHELGALLSAPMERVAERSYSYRPNALYPKDPNRRLIPRLARVPEDGVETRMLDQQHQVRVPKRLELLDAALKYDKRGQMHVNYYRFDDRGGAPYRGGQGAGEMLNSKHNLHKTLAANPSQPTHSVEVPSVVQDGYLATLHHLVDLSHGHFSERHPDVPQRVSGEEARKRILKAAAKEVFQPGDLIWVEWDVKKQCIVSLGWHYYYRWAYTDSVRKKSGKLERRELLPLKGERECDGDGAPKELSSVRRLFGYTRDQDNSSTWVGSDDYAQLMGRVSVNAALEVVGDDETDDQRFMPPTFLRELGMPRPSAVEHYLKQPDYPNPQGRSDKAWLLTYGDAAGYDTPGELAGRKFYLDRKDAYSSEPWKDDSPSNRANERSTLALEASRPGRRFRFTIRFRDLDPEELAAIMVALCPHQFRDVLKGTHPDGYCSKLGYARPLGWGTVRIEAKALLLLDSGSNKPALKAEVDILGWVRKHHQRTPMQDEWLAIHRHKHPDACDYPQKDGQIYTFHTYLRSEHSRLRRYHKDNRL
jgi:hypothetical protein